MGIWHEVRYVVLRTRPRFPCCFDRVCAYHLLMPPIGAGPMTQAPVTQAPVTQAPVTQAPVTQAPRGPAVGKPVVET
jgi:hypothetical protein